MPTGWFEQVLSPGLATAAPAPPEQDAWISGRFHRIPAPSLNTAAPRRAARPAPPRRRTGTAGAQRGVVSRMRAQSWPSTSPQGDGVTAGAVVVRVEAMKMENPVRAVADGTVETVHVRSDSS